MLMLSVEQLFATAHQQRRACFRTPSQMEEQNPTQSFIQQPLQEKEHFQ